MNELVSLDGFFKSLLSANASHRGNVDCSAGMSCHVMSARLSPRHGPGIFQQFRMA